MAKWISVDDEKKPAYAELYCVVVQNIEDEDDRYISIGTYVEHAGIWRTENPLFEYGKEKVTHWLDELEMPEEEIITEKYPFKIICSLCHENLVIEKKSDWEKIYIINNRDHVHNWHNPFVNSSLREFCEHQFVYKQIEQDSCIWCMKPKK